MRLVKVTQLELAFVARTAWSYGGDKLGARAACAAAKGSGGRFVLELALWTGLARLFAARRSLPLFTCRARVLRGFFLVLELSRGARRARRRRRLGVLPLAACLAPSDF